MRVHVWWSGRSLGKGAEDMKRGVGVRFRKPHFTVKVMRSKKSLKRVRHPQSGVFNRYSSVRTLPMNDVM